MSNVIQFPFERLEVWQLAFKIAKNIYLVSKSFPPEERYGLTDQLRRAATSVSLNIAEGKGRYYYKDFVRFLLTARGSLYETITIIYLASELGYLDNDKRVELLVDCNALQAQLMALIKNTRDKSDIAPSP